MLEVRRIDKKFYPDCSRVITKPYIPQNEKHIENIINRVLNLSEAEIDKLLDRLVSKFIKRHKNIWKIFDYNFNLIKMHVPQNKQISDNRRYVIGAHFTCEYSIQTAGFFNPSIVMHPDQSNLPEGALRFILSFRSVGEGHISSIEFRSGIVDKDSNFTLDNVSHYAERGCVVDNPLYDKTIFFCKLFYIKNQNYIIFKQIYDLLPDKFFLSDLIEVLQILIDPAHKHIAEIILNLAKSNYQLQFKPDDDLSEKVIFPVSSNESNGIEDARFVKFTDDDGTVTYYATYTAYDGHNILPQLIETKDFINFKVNTLCGDFSKNKGMALFPRKINGKYMMISRIDGESLYLMSSENIYFWQNAEPLKIPETGWEFVQIGNCGSPVETEKGWILLTHGVGAMREYSIGVILLDIDNPSRIIGNMIEPLITCNQDEREGYVPNVVYSCGSMVHNDNLIVPYAMSDVCSGIATVSLSNLFNNMQKNVTKNYVELSQEQKYR